MSLLAEKDARILGLIADNPGKYGDLLELLQGEAHKIGTALVREETVDDSTADAVREAKDWANQSRERPSSAQ